ncbi:MAG: addiction module antidote protein [Pseudomonadota bacterium]
MAKTGKKDQFTELDPATLLNTAEVQAEAITEAFESGDAGLIAHTIGLVARSRGMTSVAEETGIARPSLYRALSQDGNPRLNSLVEIFAALNIKIEAKISA